MKDNEKLYFLGLNTNKTFWQNAPDDQEAYESIEQSCNYLDNLLYENACYVSLNDKQNLLYSGFDIYSYASTLEDVQHALRIIEEYEELQNFNYSIVAYN